MGINQTKIKFPKEENIKPVKTIILHTKSVTSLIQLKDKRIASCSQDGTIRIFDPSNDYHCDEVIKISKDGIESICELDDGTIVSCTWDRIIIGNYTMKITDRTIIYKVITLPDNRIATCLYDGLIKI